MATISKVRRLANPFKRAATRKRKKNALRSRSRRRMTAKQIKHFGTKRQKAALKRKRTVTAKKANPGRRKVKGSAVRRHRRNPALLVTLGANPRRHSMAKRRRRTAAKKNVHRRRRVVAKANPIRRRRRVAVHHRRRRVANPRRRVHVRRRNPSVFGTKPFSSEGVKVIAGGLLGVAAAKFIPKFIPSSITGGMGVFGAILTTAVSTFAAAWAAEKFLGDKVGSAVLFGGLMQTGSVALTALAPGLSVGGVPLALSGLGDLVPGQFVVPQNPLRLPPAPAPSARANVTMSGLARAFGPAF